MQSVLSVFRPRWKGSTLQILSYCSMSSFHRSAPYFLSYAALSPAGTPSGPKISALKPYSFSISARKGIVSSKRWKVSTTITLHLPVLR